MRFLNMHQIESCKYFVILSGGALSRSNAEIGSADTETE